MDRSEAGKFLLVLLGAVIVIILWSANDPRNK